jgi:CDP-diacylglycerol--glycerol-3-phosphate 3-phosphatidyltransferase
MTATIWTLPNVLTGLRFLAVPAVAWVLAVAGASTGGRLIALGLFVAASVTDLADGWLARRLGQCTDFGALLDPIADKALVGTSLVCLSGLGIIPWWATGVILAREIAVTLLRLIVLRIGVIPASRGGKVKTVTQTVLIVVALATPGWDEALWVAVAVAVVWTVATGLDYVAKAASLTRTAVPVPRPALAAVDSVDATGGAWWGRVWSPARQQAGAAESSRMAS